MNTKTVKVKTFVFMEQGYARDANGKTDYYSPMVWSPTTWTCRVDDNDRRIFVGEQMVSVEVPVDFDPRPIQIQALEERERELRAKFAAAVAEIHRRISELTAIEYTPGEAA